MSVLTLHFKEEILSETGEPSGKVRSLEILGAFVEGGALIMGLSEEVTAFVPLSELTWASVYEGSSSGSGDEAAEEGSEDDSGSAGAEGGSVIPIVGKSVSSDEGAGSES